MPQVNDSSWIFLFFWLLSFLFIFISLIQSFYFFGCNKKHLVLFNLKFCMVV